MESIDNNNNVTPPTASGPDITLRPVILETVKESYLLSPNSIPSSSSSVADARRTYDIALILEAEVVVEEEPPLVGESERNAVLDGDNNDTSSPTKPFHDLSTTAEKTEPPQIVAQQSKSVRKPPVVEDILLLPTSSPPTDSLTLEDETVIKPQFALQVLQRNLTRDMFRFVSEGVYVKEDGGGGGMETEWVIQVKDWKWAPKSLSSRERV